MAPPDRWRGNPPRSCRSLPDASSSPPRRRPADVVATNRKLGRVRFGIDSAPGSKEQIAFAQREIEPGTHIQTDGARVLRRLADLGYEHSYATGYNSPDISAELPGVYLVASLLKRWITGTLQHHVTVEHLPYYLDEYAFRFNRRDSKSRGMLFYQLLQQAVVTEPTTLNDLYKI